MTTFDEREQAFERLFVNEEAMRFRIRARRNGLLAIWVCERMRLDKEATEHFVDGFADRAILMNDEALLTELQVALEAAGAEDAIPDLRIAMERCSALARTEQRILPGSDRNPLT